MRLPSSARAAWKQTCGISRRLHGLAEESGVSGRSSVEMVLGDEPVKCPSANAQGAGGLDLVSLLVLQHLEDVAPLDLPQVMWVFRSPLVSCWPADGHGLR